MSYVLGRVLAARRRDRKFLPGLDALQASGRRPVHLRQRAVAAGARDNARRLRIQHEFFVQPDPVLLQGPVDVSICTNMYILKHRDAHPDAHLLMVIYISKHPVNPMNCLVFEGGTHGMYMYRYANKSV